MLLLQDGMGIGHWYRFGTGWVGFCAWDMARVGAGIDCTGHYLTNSVSFLLKVPMWMFWVSCTEANDYF